MRLVFTLNALLPKSRVVVPVVALSRTDYRFPDPQGAEREPNGLLAVGGDLAPERLLQAYAQGIFPWFDTDPGPILWWSPDPRAVLVPGAFKPSRSLRRSIRRGEHGITFDSAFADVIGQCATVPRPGQAGTWITSSMQEAYCRLHQLGFAHSVETWRDGRLVGGLYGLSLGNMFFGESMFSAAPDGSKHAFAALCERLARWKFSLLDCQMMNDHLARLGVWEMSRTDYLERLRHNDLSATRRGSWTSGDH